MKVDCRFTDSGQKIRHALIVMKAAVVRQCKDTVGACLPGKQLSCDPKERIELHFGTFAAESLPSHSRHGQMFADRFQILIWSNVC